MKLYTIFELAARSDTELHAIYSEAFNEIARCKEDSTERNNALASLQNVRRVLRSRPPRP